MKEFIICSAILVDDNKEYEDQPYGIKFGFVVCGRRHSDCYNIITSICLITKSFSSIQPVSNLAKRENQGFITNTNRFVRRNEAYKIARNAKQILNDIHDTNSDNNILTSEDLFKDDLRMTDDEIGEIINKHNLF